MLSQFYQTCGLLFHKSVTLCLESAFKKYLTFIYVKNGDCLKFSFVKTTDADNVQNLVVKNRKGFHLFVPEYTKLKIQRAAKLS